MRTFLASAIIASATAFDCTGLGPNKVMSSIDATAYMGTWYEQSHALHQPFQSDDWSCTEADYTNLDTSLGTFDVYNSSESKR
mmetsp:Transcript_42171/g.30353  ORF Transcript_42171/g.30353 Transcript_42171/m.30353 type:complete len:83 (-) Transcript_42171:424-672(-)